MICYIPAIRSFCCKGYCSELEHLLKPVVANRHSLQLPLPFIVCVALPFPSPASRSIRSIVRRTSWHVSKCGKKGEASEYCCVRVGKSFTPPFPRWEKKMKGTKKRGVYCSRIWQFLLPARHHNARRLRTHIVHILHTHSSYIFPQWKC